MSNNRFKNLVENKPENINDINRNEKEKSSNQNYTENNIFIKSETIYFQNKKNNTNLFKKNTKKNKERYNTFNGTSKKK